MISKQDRSINILVADWNEVNATSLSRILNLFHFYTDQTYTGQNLIHILDKTDYDIIFLNHWMPDMSGQDIIKEIRKLRVDGKPVIYVLVPEVSEELINKYQEAGANRVFEKPLKIEQFLNDIRLYFPELSLFITDSRKAIDNYHWNMIRLAFSDVKQINIETGIQSSLMNHTIFIQIMKSTYHEISSFVSMVSRYTELEDNSDLKLRLHNLKSILAYIGAEKLLEDTKRIEAGVKGGNYEAVGLQLGSYIEQLELFMRSMKRALDNYDDLTELQNGERDMLLQYNPGESYEQCIQKTIYYIKRFEYDLILNELSKLISRKNNHQQVFMKAAEEIRNFNYEGALEYINQITNRKDE